MDNERKITITCAGCENECEVVVIIHEGAQPTCLGGNNCPTGESYALAQAQRLVEECRGQKIG